MRNRFAELGQRCGHNWNCEKEIALRHCHNVENVVLLCDIYRGAIEYTTGLDGRPTLGGLGCGCELCKLCVCCVSRKRVQVPKKRDMSRIFV